jgi:hypothetical protein
VNTDIKPLTALGGDKTVDDKKAISDHTGRKVKMRMYISKAAHSLTLAPGSVPLGTMRPSAAGIAILT